jgi:hypothetical protein
MTFAKRSDAKRVFFLLYITLMGHKAKSTGNWKVNNSPGIKCVAKRQQTRQQAKCQLAAQGYNNARMKNLLPGKVHR